MNPMIRKELRQRMRERQGWLLPTLYLTVLSAVIVLAYHVRIEGYPLDYLQGWQIGVTLFMTAAYTQLTLLLLLAPIFSSAALTIEKEQHTFSALLTSLLTPGQIWRGKFVASLLFVLLLLIAGLPVVSAAFAFGGVGWWEVGMTTVTTVAILAAINAISLYWSSVFRRSVHATAVGYVSVVALTAVTFIIFLVAESILQGPRWAEAPLWARAPLYFNPVFFMTMALVPRDQLYPEWVICLLVFAGLAVISALRTIRNLRRSGEAT
jgi:hypothetical protein